MARNKKSDNNLVKIIVWVVIVGVVLNYFGVVDIGSIINPDLDPDFPDMAVYEDFLTAPTCGEGSALWLDNQAPDDFDDRYYRRNTPQPYCEGETFIAFGGYDDPYGLRSLGWRDNHFWISQKTSITHSSTQNNLKFGFMRYGHDNNCGSDGWNDFYGDNYFVINNKDSANWDILFDLYAEYKLNIEIGYFDKMPEKLEYYSELDNSDNYECLDNSNPGNLRKEVSENGERCWVDYRKNCRYSDSEMITEHGVTCEVKKYTCNIFTEGATERYCWKPYHCYYRCTEDKSKWKYKSQTISKGGIRFTGENIEGARYDDDIREWQNYVETFENWYDDVGYTDVYPNPGWHKITNVEIDGDTTILLERSRLNPDEFLLKRNGKTFFDSSISQDEYYLALKFIHGESPERGRSDCDRNQYVEPEIDKVLYKVPFEGCAVEEGEVVVRKDFGAGAQINLEVLNNLNASLKRFCINNPPQILKIGTGQEPETMGQIFTELVRGQTITVPDGYVYKISYVTNYQRGMQRDCPIGSAVINADTGECEEYASDIISPDDLPQICQDANITDYEVCNDYVMDVINNLEGSLDDKIDLINQLNATIQEKAEIISQMQENIANQAQIIDQLEATVEEKAEIIASLQTELEEQGSLINQLEATVEEKAQLINALELELDEQETIINNLNLNLQKKIELINQLEITNEEQQQLIDQMRGSFAEQAEIIDSLNQTIKEDAELIKDYKLSLEAQSEIIKNLRLTNAEQAELINALRLSNDEMAVLIENLELTTDEQVDLIKELELSNLEMQDLVERLRLTTDQQQDLIDNYQAKGSCPAIVQSLPGYIGFDETCSNGWLIIIGLVAVLIWFIASRD